MEKVSAALCIPTMQNIRLHLSVLLVIIIPIHILEHRMPVYKGCTQVVYTPCTLTHKLPTPLKKSSVWYQNHFFRLLCEIWVETIECLPGYSEGDKQNAILKTGELCYMKNAKQFLVYRRQGFYSFRSVMKYWHVWKKVTCPQNSYFPGLRLVLQKPSYAIPRCL